MNPSSHHWTIASTNTKPSSLITQPPTCMTPTPHVSISQPARHPYTSNIPSSAPLSSQLETFVDLDGLYCLEKVFKGIRARIIYPHGPKLTNSEPCGNWKFLKRALVATYLDGPASCLFSSFSETDNQN